LRGRRAGDEGAQRARAQRSLQCNLTRSKPLSPGLSLRPPGPETGRGEPDQTGDTYLTEFRYENRRY
jgi:hypothetical protein